MKDICFGMKKDLANIWNKSYTWMIPCLTVLSVMGSNYIFDYRMADLCLDDNFSDMLTAIITSMSIVISIFGFLMPSLVSAKSDKMVRYFIENADMEEFVKKIKSVIRSGMIGILFSIVLYVNENFFLHVRTVVLYAWLWINIKFVCCSYRFIGIIISLLLKEKKDVYDVECPNLMAPEAVNELKGKLKKF